jgi:hypothetical protein
MRSSGWQPERRGRRLAQIAARERGVLAEYKQRLGRPHHLGHAGAHSQLTYLDVASGSIPLFLILSDALVEARNSISRLEGSISLEPATTAAENTWTSWISGGIVPAKSTPGACRISLTG